MPDNMRFGQLLKDQSVLPLSDYRPYSPTGKALPRCWLGARFKSPSIPSIVLPTPSFPENENANETGVKIKDREDRVYQNTGWYGGNGEIKADLLRAGEGRAATEAHAREQAAKYTPTRPKSFSEMAGSVPYDNSSPEAEKICRSFRGPLIKGMAPRINALVKDTGLPKESIESYLSGAPWVRKDDSSPAGIVVYLPVEALA